MCLSWGLQLREALSEMFGVKNAKGILHRLKAGKFIHAWNQAKIGRSTQQRVHTASSSTFLMITAEPCSKLDASRYGDADGLSQAESLALIVSLQT